MRMKVGENGSEWVFVERENCESGGKIRMQRGGGGGCEVLK